MSWTVSVSWDNLIHPFNEVLNYIKGINYNIGGLNFNLFYFLIFVLAMDIVLTALIKFLLSY